MNNFESKDDYEKFHEVEVKKPPYETPARARLRVAKEKKDRMKKIIDENKEKYNPKADKKGLTEDAYKTIFVARLVGAVQMPSKHQALLSPRLRGHGNLTQRECCLGARAVAVH